MPDVLEQIQTRDWSDIDDPDRQVENCAWC